MPGAGSIAGGYYTYKKRPKNQRRIDNEKLLIDIRRIFLDNNSNYGSPRTLEPIEQRRVYPLFGKPCCKSHARSQNCCYSEAQVPLTTNSKHDYPVWPNILCRNFDVDRLNTVWVSDITYIWTFEGWLYLAVVLDLFSRGVVGLAMDKTIADTLVIQAMSQAILRRNPNKA